MSSLYSLGTIICIYRKYSILQEKKSWVKLSSGHYTEIKRKFLPGYGKAAKETNTHLDN